jgi:hypothetical protein
MLVKLLRKKTIKYMHRSVSSQGSQTPLDCDQDETSECTNQSQTLEEQRRFLRNLYLHSKQNPLDSLDEISNAIGNKLDDCGDEQGKVSVDDEMEFAPTTKESQNSQSNIPVNNVDSILELCQSSINPSSMVPLNSNPDLKQSLSQTELSENVQDTSSISKHRVYLLDQISRPDDLDKSEFKNVNDSHQEWEFVVNTNCISGSVKAMLDQLATCTDDFFGEKMTDAKMSPQMSEKSCSVGKYAKDQVTNEPIMVASREVPFNMEIIVPKSRRIARKNTQKFWSVKDTNMIEESQENIEGNLLSVDTRNCVPVYVFADKYKEEVFNEEKQADRDVCLDGVSVTSSLSFRG